MGRIALALVVAFALAGCGVRLTDAQAGQLSQAKADAQAAAACTDAQARAVLLTAAHNRLLAGLADLDLPPPVTAPAELVTPDGVPVLPKVEAEARAAKAAADDPPAGMLGVVLGGVGGVALAALGVLRFSPGAFGMVANLAHAYLAPRATRDMRAAQAKAAEVAEQAVVYGHTLAQAAKANGLGDAVEEINAKSAAVQDRLGIRPQVAAILAAVKARQGSPVASSAPTDRVPT
jgi:hypothetical protein